MSNILSKEAQILVDSIYNFGCLSINQAKIILEGVTKPSAVVKFLCLNQYVKFIDDTYIVAFKHPEPDREIIDCLWVAFDQFTEDGEFDIDAFSQCFKGEKPCNLCGIKNNLILNFIYTTENNLTNISFLQERFYSRTKAKPGKEDKKGIVHILVSRDVNILGKLEALNLSFPFVVAILSGPSKEQPQIEYYEAK